jgi:hypothetical protein
LVVWFGLGCFFPSDADALYMLFIS